MRTNVSTKKEMKTKTAKPKCDLVGTDGNVFSLIGAVSACLKNNDQRDKAKEFVDKALSANSYDQVLRIIHDYVEAC